MTSGLTIQTSPPLKLLIQADAHELVMALASPVGGGEANAGANAGGAIEVFRDVTGGALIFRTLDGVGGVNIAENGDLIDFFTHVAFLVAPTVTDDIYEVGTLWTNTVLATSFILRDNSAGAAQWDQIAGPAWQKDTFASLAAQVTFILAQPPSDANSLELDVNGVTYEGGGVDYSISGQTITWLNTAFIMSLGDSVVVRSR